MLVADIARLGVLMEVIVQTSHGMTDTAGRRAHVSTIDPKALRTAAVTALMIATGNVVIPGDERVLVRAQPEPMAGILHTERVS